MGMDFLMPFLLTKISKSIDLTHLLNLNRIVIGQEHLNSQLFFTYKTNFVLAPARSRGNLVPGNLVRGLVSTQGAWYGPGMLKGLPG